MKTLSIDIESYSSNDIAKGGAYKYADADDFQILLFAYSVDEGPVKLVDLAQGEEIPQPIIDALFDETVTKWAFNANFERVCLSRWARDSKLLDNGEFLDPRGWRCTMVWAGALGLPVSLAKASEALGLEIEKMEEGKKLIQKFCVPHNREQASLFNPQRDPQNRPEDYPQDWETFCAYNVRDVEVELGIREKLEPWPLEDWIWDQYAIDQMINDNGIYVDLELAEQAVKADEHHHKQLSAEACEITGLANPNSVQQLRGWLAEQGQPLDSLAKAAITESLETATGDVKRVLQLRQELARSSVKKYQAMMRATCHDGRAHGLLQFYGAARTGRWAGRLIQVQNLPQNHLPDLATARQLIRDGDADTVDLLYGSLPDTLSQLIRTAFIPREGHKFIVADYNAIEARVLAWLAGQTSTLTAFEQGKDLYCHTASMMFGIPVEKHGVNGHLRQKGKIAVLACGYGGGPGALKAMGALNMGINEDELQPIVDDWRNANHMITQYWYDINSAAIKVIKTGKPQTVRGVSFTLDQHMMCITLPSGRRLHYPKAEIGENKWGNPSITFLGVGANRKFQRIETYGGKLTENITQAVARDLLAHALTTVTDAGYRIVMHVHDEMVVDTPLNADIDTLCTLMSQTPAWAAGLPVKADGYECTFYQKD